MVFNQVSLY